MQREALFLLASRIHGDELTGAEGAWGDHVATGRTLRVDVVHPQPTVDPQRQLDERRGRFAASGGADRRSGRIGRRGARRRRAVLRTHPGDDRTQLFRRCHRASRLRLAARPGDTHPRAAFPQIDQGSAGILTGGSESGLAQPVDHLPHIRLGHRDGRGQGPQREVFGGVASQHRGQGGGVLAPHERRRHPDPQLSVFASDVLDQIGQGLGDGRAGVRGEHREQLAAAASGVECAAHAALRHAVHRGRTPGFEVGHQVHLFGEVWRHRPGNGQGQIGLGEEVVDRFGQCHPHRGEQT